MELREQIARAIENTSWILPAGLQNDVVDAALEVIQPIIEERDALRAEIEAMKKQEFVAEIVQNSSGQIRLIGRDKGAFDISEHVGERFYARPCAQWEPVIDTVVDYLVSISAHVAHQDDATAQAEIGDLLKMLAAGAQGEKE